MSPDHHDRFFLPFTIGQIEITLALIISHLSNILFTQSTHHLFIVDQWAIREDRPLPSLGFLTGNLYRTLDSPAKPCTFRSNNFHVV